MPAVMYNTANQPQLTFAATLPSVQTVVTPPPATPTSPPAPVQRPMDVAQQAATIGASVPIVFCRQIAGRGGVMISPPASEARFENSLTNQVTAYYLLVVSEGFVDPIAVKDVFSGACRHGSHTQTFDRRAGTWIPENAIVLRSGYTLPECPQSCGSIGSYPNITTVSFSRQVANGSTLWNRQVWLFIRGGINVTRLADSSYGASNNFADLCNYLLSNIGKLSSSMIDTNSLTLCAKFIDANGLSCDTILTQQQNYEELIAKWSPFFFVRPSRINGKRGLRPLLPITPLGIINTTNNVAVYQFDEDTILPDTFNLTYAELTQRQPFVVSVVWRQQAEDDIGISRTVDVRYSDTDPSTAASETHDISEFCTNGQHAAMVGAHILASRVGITHSITFQARPQAHNVQVELGSIVRVKLRRTSTGQTEAVHDFLYEVTSKNKSIEGVVSYECIHHPVDQQGRSIVALAVASVIYDGGLVNTTKTGPSCDESPGRATDDSVPAETFVQVGNEETPPTEDQLDAIVPSTAILLGNLPIQGTASGTVTNPDDGLDAS
jgi:hypothetical protein